MLYTFLKILVISDGLGHEFKILLATTQPPCNPHDPWQWDLDEIDDVMVDESKKSLVSYQLLGEMSESKCSLAMC